MRWNKTFTVVDCHAEGEIGRVVTGGIPPIPGETVFDKRVWLQENYDELRQLILFEPRGSVHHNANVIVPSNHPEAQAGYVILESTEYPVMSGSNTMCVATVLLETGMVAMTEPTTELTLESAAGLIRVSCDCKDGKVERVRFVNQPAFAYHLDVLVNVPELGPVLADIAYGGMTYVIVDATQLGLTLDRAHARQLVEMGQAIKLAAAEQFDVTHPENPGIPGITNFQFTEPVQRRGDRLHARNTVVVSPGRVDRSPCGTGTSARLALLHAKGQIGVGETLIHESIIGTTFEASVVSTTRVGDYDAVVPSVAGQAWITGICQVGLDPSDPFPRGFTVADTWLRELDGSEPLQAQPAIV